MDELSAAEVKSRIAAGDIESLWKYDQVSVLIVTAGEWVIESLWKNDQVSELLSPGECVDCDDR